MTTRTVSTNRWVVRLACVLLYTAGTLGAGEAPRFIEMVGVDVDPAQTVCQKIVPVENACTPASVLSALRFGPPSFRKVLDGLPGKSDKERLTHLIETFGNAPSVVEPDRKVFNPQYGIYSDDFPQYFRAILGADAPDHLTGMYFDLAENEKPEAHLWRVHRLLAHSLQQGVPVITSIRSFGAVQHGEKYLWDGLAGHTVLIVRVPKELAAEAEGFVCRFIEPSTGLVREGYIFSETARGFQAAKGSGEKKFKWLDRGFLQITAPSLVIETSKQPWYARTFLTLNYGLGEFPEQK